jgi:hypothetical protein
MKAVIPEGRVSGLSATPLNTADAAQVPAFRTTGVVLQPG